MAKKIKRKHVYLISGWTNLSDDVRKWQKPYHLEETKKGENIAIPEQWTKPSYPCRIVVSDKPFIKGSAKFSRFLLYHLGLIPFEEARLRVPSHKYTDFDGYGHTKCRLATLNDIKSGNVLFPADKGELEHEIGEVEPEEGDKRYVDSDYKFERTRIFPGKCKGIELAVEEEISVKLLGVELDTIKRIPHNVIETSYLLHETNFAGVPRRHRLFSGEKALAELVRKNFEFYIPLFKKLVEKYEGRKI